MTTVGTSGSSAGATGRVASDGDSPTDAASVVGSGVVSVVSVVSETPSGAPSGAPSGSPTVSSVSPVSIGSTVTGLDNGPMPPVVTARTAKAKPRDLSSPSSRRLVATPASKHLDPSSEPSPDFFAPHGECARSRIESVSVNTTDAGGSTAGNERGSH